MTAKKRPDELQGKTLSAQTECGRFYLTMNQLDGELFEVKFELGKQGTCVRGLIHCMGVFISILLQEGLEKKVIKKIMTKHLVKLGCGNTFIHKGNEYKSCMDWASEKIIAELEVK